MKKRVLLIDESLTVQKVVALTLDRGRYAVSYARSRAEAMKQVVDNPPDLILVSDQVTDITIPSFPKEVEAWLGRGSVLPPLLLITGHDIKEYRHYAGVLKKPFSPQALQNLINKHTQPGENPMVPMSESSYPNNPNSAGGPGPGYGSGVTSDEYEDQRLQKIFNDAFADEGKLMKETFQAEHEAEERTLLNQVPSSTPRAEESWEERSPAPARVPSPKTAPSGRVPGPGDLWNVAPPGQAAKGKPPADVLTAEDSMAYKAVLENQVESKLGTQDLEEVVDKILAKLVPPIVERLVQERLDQLLREQEQSPT